MRRIIPLVPWLGLALALSACASAEREGARPDAAAPPSMQATPQDLTIDLTVRCDRRGAEGTAPSPRSGRYVLFPDGSLHADPGLDDPHVLPERARVLSARQVDAVWALLRELGLDRPDGDPAPTNLATVVPAPGECVHVLALEADGRRWLHVERTDGGAAARVRERLAALAWSSDRPEPPVTVIPRRYDLGPDPYARYRR